MTAMYTALATTTLSSASSSVTFGSIPQGYRDLMLVCDFQQTSTGVPYIQFNSDSGSNYSRVYMVGNGSAGTSSSGTTTSYPLGYFFSNNEILNKIEILDYSATDKHKTFLDRMNNPVGSGTAVQATAGRWASTSAITQIALTAVGDFTAGSTFSLYGIAGGS